MKAIVVRGPFRYGMEEIPVREPGPGEVLIRIEAVGLCGTDYGILSNEMQYYKTGQAKLPIVPGHEWAGCVEKVGPGVKEFQVRDQVTGECTVRCGFCSYCQEGRPHLCENRTETGVMNRDGGYAQYITFPAASLHRVSGISMDWAALVEPAGIAMQAVKRADIKPEDNVLVIGPGPIGLLAAQIAKKICGAKCVIISGTRDERLVRAAAYTDAAVNIRKEDLKEVVLKKTGGHGIDAVVVAAGTSGVFRDCENVMAPGGRISICGFFDSAKADCNWDFISTNSIDIRGSLGSPNVWPFVISCIESGRLDVENIISHRMTLESTEDFQRAVDMMQNRTDDACKIILYPNGVKHEPKCN